MNAINASLVDQDQHDANGVPTDNELLSRFQPVFDRIAAGTLQREERRELPYEAVGWLRTAGFGALRVPRAYGGIGATVSQLFRLLTLLGEADSNLPQILRAHFGFVEGRLNDSEDDQRQRWFPKVVAGELFGAAMAERTGETRNSVTLKKEGDDWRVDGEKYYCTGTLYADWIAASTADGDDHVSVVISTTAAGVTRLDDWDGFGQRLTGSGTTRFENVLIGEDQVIRRFKTAEGHGQSYITAFYQLVHLATLAGISRAALRDSVDFVKARTRTFGVPGQTSPRQDPLVQRVVGRLSSLSFAAEAVVDRVSAGVEEVWQAHQAGTADVALYAAAEIKAYQGQQVAIDLVLQATTLLFEVGGASATSTPRHLDRHWRNARTVSSHNPAILRERALGDFYLNDITPSEAWAERLAKDKAEKDANAIPQTTEEQTQ
jgi:alkylation response protein AidB-like acyl-CoA dehydrogenase